MPPVLDALERFYDTAPRVSGSAEAFGSVTLFRAPPGGFPYYLRPTLGHRAPVDVADVRVALDRQRELGLPRTAEWVAETTPSMLAAAEQAGLRAHAYPLMVRGGPAEAPHLPTRMLAAAFLDGELVASGQHNPVADVTEIVGVATLPAARRRGAGRAVTAALVADATAGGIGTSPSSCPPPTRRWHGSMPGSASRGSAPR